MDFKINWSGRAIDYTNEEIAAVVEVMKTGDPQTQGKYLKKFESDFAEFVGSPHCFGVTNCTHALELIADLTRLGPEDEVIIPGHTYCASAIPFGRTGAKLKWADIDPETFLVSLNSIKALTTKKTKAIVVVHLYGKICDMSAIAQFAKENGIYLIEDVAQAIGATQNGKRAGSFGDFAAFSFHGQKNVTTMGEGGVLVVKDPQLAKLVPGLRHNGHVSFPNQSRYWIPAMTNIDLDMVGIWPHNFSLTEAQAALGSVLLRRVDSLNKERRKRAIRFQEALQEFPELKFQKEGIEGEHVYHLLPAWYDGTKTGKTRDDLLNLLSTKYAVKAIVQYYPLYRYDLFKKMNLGEARCPQTDFFFDRMVSFPFHLWMSDADFNYLIQSVQSALTELRAA